MIKLTASHALKVPLPGKDFSSQQFHAEIQLELSEVQLDSNTLKEEIRNAFVTVRHEVQRQVSGAIDKSPDFNGRNGNGYVPRNGSITDKQISFVRSLASQKGLSPEELNTAVFDNFGAGSLQQLDRKEASSLVSMLKTRNGTPTAG